ncbi:MAG: hypothetical protein H7318_05155 [Oligoflexus sp.]|nr:hypothetical protein [Oligoflexus sp.]
MPDAGRTYHPTGNGYDWLDIGGTATSADRREEDFYKEVRKTHLLKGAAKTYIRPDKRRNFAQNQVPAAGSDTSCSTAASE